MITTSDLAPLSLNKVKSSAVTCPICQARQVAAVTSWTAKGQETVRVRFDCDHDPITRLLQTGKGKR